MKTKRDIRNNGIRLTLTEPNTLKNYSKYTRKKKKKKKKKKKRSVKAVLIEPKQNAIDKIMNEQSFNSNDDIEIIDTDSSEIIEVETKKIDIVKGRPDISEKDPNIKKVKVDNIKEEKDKKGTGILME